MTTVLASISLREEQDVVFARQQARQIAKMLGFDTMGQARLATAVSEIARNAFMYAGGGRVSFEVEGATVPQVLTIRVSDAGRGFADPQPILAGRFVSTGGLGLGIAGTRRMMDVFDLQTSPSGSVVTMKKMLPAAAATASDLVRIKTDLTAARASGPLAVVREQNQELLRALDDLSQRQEDLERVNRELDDTNRGVVALYAELDERADQLRRVDEVKTRFLSNMTHEFRTPVNSILALTALLADRLEMDPQEKNEVHFIRRSAMQLAEMVDDLLDIAKVESGKVEVHLAIFEVRDLFGALRGMLRPLLVNDAVTLVFDDGEALPPVCSDEGKVSQILRNLVSNALKYTERGEVRVSARLAGDGVRAEFAVADTGIGIPYQDLGRIFDEFVQIENPIQRRVKGTGLGLPLSKRLAELLGGDIAVRSTLGEGSTFALSIPLMPADPSACPGPKPLDPAWRRDRLESRVPGQTPARVLVIDDEDASRFIVREILSGVDYEVLEASTGADGLRLARRVRPDCIVLDLHLGDMEGLEVSDVLRQDPQTAQVPVVVMTSRHTSAEAQARLGATAVLSKAEITRERLRAAVDRALGRNAAPAAGDRTS